MTSGFYCGVIVHGMVCVWSMVLRYSSAAQLEFIVSDFRRKSKRSLERCGGQRAVEFL